MVNATLDIKGVLILDKNVNDVEEIKIEYSEIVENIEIIMVIKIIDCELIYE